MNATSRAALGLDFGTESVRALIVDLAGNELASAVHQYRHGQIIAALPTGKTLPPHFALQHPLDWIDAASRAVRRAVRDARSACSEIIGIGVDFTSCTMLPARRDGTPLCVLPEFSDEPQAWAKLWKHHGAEGQAQRLNSVAHRRHEPFLRRYGGTIGLEWFFPKVLETLENAPEVYDAAEVWIEAGDWLVWQLVGGDAAALPRSTCQAGYKAMWNARDGYPSQAYLRAVHPRLASVVREKMPGRLLSPGQPAGELTGKMARAFGLPSGIPVSAAIIDAHAGVPGAGAARPGTLVMVMGTSSCHMLNATEERFVPGVAGVVEGGILAGYFGYETGQSAVGDAFDWLRRLSGQRDFTLLLERATALPPGADGVLCLDWLNGCRTPLMDGSLTGALVGLQLRHTSAHLYRAMIEATAFGLRWIVELLRGHGLPVNEFVATGGLPHRNVLLAQIYADVLGEPVIIHPSKQGPALGAAILGALAAGRKESGFTSPSAAIRAMAAPRKGVPGREARLLKPDKKHHLTYRQLYRDYRKLAEERALAHQQRWRERNK